jgi:glucan phosphoethanolaminetransferase (alkaline phosphatase superfamily)
LVVFCFFLYIYLFAVIVILYEKKKKKKQGGRTSSILLPMTIFTMSFEDAYVSNSLNHASKLLNVSRFVTSYTSDTAIQYNVQHMPKK